MKLSIVIPCYNESKTIRTIVDRVRAAPVTEIIIVEDCSRDGTRDLLRTQIAPLVDKIIYHEVIFHFLRLRGAARFQTAESAPRQPAGTHQPS